MYIEGIIRYMKSEKECRGGRQLKHETIEEQRRQWRGKTGRRVSLCTGIGRKKVKRVIRVDEGLCVNSE